MNVNICIGNITNTQVAIYSFKKQFTKDHVMMEIYINDFYISSLQLTNLSFNHLPPIIMTCIMMDMYEILKNIKFNEFYNIDIDGPIRTRENDDQGIISNRYMNILIIFNNENFEEFKEILSFAEWYCGINSVNMQFFDIIC